MVKLIGGLVGNSFALSDAVNSLGDCPTSILVFFALRVAQRPPDDEHPYGHTRAEAIAATNVAIVIILSALTIGWEAVRRLGSIHAGRRVDAVDCRANVLIKEALYQYKVRVGRRVRSAAVIANAWDHRSDALCSAAVLIGLAVVRWGGPDLIWADEAAALVVVSAITFTGVRLFRKAPANDGPAGRSADGGRSSQRGGTTSRCCAVEKLWVRKTGLEYLTDIHIEVDEKLSVAEGHRIGHCVKDRLLDAFPGVRDVLVHLEPHPPVVPLKVSGANGAKCERK